MGVPGFQRIDSFLCKAQNIDFTVKRRFGAGGALVNTIVPDKSLPGLFGEKTFTRIASASDSATFRSVLDHGEFNGLQLDKHYKLTDKGLDVKITFTNIGKKNLLPPAVCRTLSFQNPGYGPGLRLIG